MAQLANATLETDVVEHINPEFIQRTVLYTIGRKPYVFNSIANVRDLRGESTRTYSHPLIDELTAAVAQLETDEVSAAQMTRADLTVATGTSGRRVILSYEAIQRSLIGEFTAAITEVTGACRRKADNDCLALFPSVSASAGTTDTTTFDLDTLAVLMNTWRTQTGSTMGRPLLVMHGDAMRDLHRDALLGGQSILATAVGTQLNDATSGLNQGVVSSWGNVDFIVTDNVPAGGTGWDNAMIATGDDEGPISMAVNQDVLVELFHDPVRRAWHVIGSLDVGFGIMRQNAALKFRSKT